MRNGRADAGRPGDDRLPASTAKTLRYDKVGTRLLLLIYGCLIAGRFTLDRLGPSWPAVDLRLAGLLMVALLFLAWRLGARKGLRRRVTTGPVLVLMLGWSGWMALSGFWSPPSARVTDGWLDLALLSVFVVLAAVVAGWLPREAMDSLWLWTVIAGLIYFVTAVAAGPGDQGRYAAPGGGPNVFVRVMVLGAIAALYLHLSGRSQWILAVIPVFAVGAVLSGSRGGLLSGALVVLLGAVPVARRLGVRRMCGLLIAGAATLWIAVLLTGSTVTDFIRARFIRQTLGERYTSGRDDITADALDLFESRPWAGVGLDGYYGLRGIYSGSEYPHSLILATAAEGGVVGLLFLGVALLAVAVVLRKLRPLSLGALFLFLAGTYVLVAQMFSGDYYDSRLMWLFFVLAAVEARRPVGKRSRTPASPPAGVKYTPRDHKWGSSR